MTTSTMTNNNAMEDVTFASADFPSAQFGLDSFYGLPPAPTNPSSLPFSFSGGFNLPFASSFSSGSDDGFSTGSPTSPDDSPSSPLSPQPYLDSMIPTLPSLGALTPILTSSPPTPSSLTSSPPQKRKNSPSTTPTTNTRARKPSTSVKKRENGKTTKGTKKGGTKKGTTKKETTKKGTTRAKKQKGPTASPSTPKIEGGEAIDQADVTVPFGVFRELNQDQVVKKKRLQRKAELARLARRKKQTRMDELERIAAELTAENQRLKAETKRLAQQALMKPVVTIANPPLTLPTVKDNDDSNLEQALAKLNALSASLSSPRSSTSTSTSTSPIAVGAATATAVDESDKQLSELMATIAVAFKKQNTSLEQAVKVLQQALAPCTALQFLEWSLAQKDQFYEREGLFMTLFRDEMGGTEEQVKQLMGLRNQMRPAKLKNQELLDSFRTFENVLNTKGTLQPEAFDQLRSIFTPKQLATYFKWVGQYGSILLKVPL